MFSSKSEMTFRVDTSAALPRGGLSFTHLVTLAMGIYNSEILRAQENYQQLLSKLMKCKPNSHQPDLAVCGPMK